MKHLLFLSALWLGATVYAQQAPAPAALTDEQAVRAVADFVLRQPVTEYVVDDVSYTSTKELPETGRANFKTPFMQWHYSNGVINMAMLKAGTFLNDPRYTQYAIGHVSRGFRDGPYFEARFKKQYPGGGVRHVGWPYGEWFTFGELDDCGAMGASVIDVQNIAPKPEYLRYINDTARHIMEGQERLPDGTLCRTFPNRMTVWADDLYMAVSFLSRMGTFSKDGKYWDDAIKQVKQITGYLWDDASQLYWHCYYDDLRRTNRAHWGRANGWILYAICQLIDNLPENHPERAEMIRLATRQILGASQYQDGDGAWRQLLDKADSYQESSITAIYTYCTAHAVNQGWLPRHYARIATAGWNGMKKLFITPDGELLNVCPGTGTSDTLVFYYTRPRSTNEKHGMGLAIDCGIEILKMNQSSPGRQ